MVAPEPAHLERFNRRRVLLLATLALATYFLIPQFGDVPEIARQVADADWAWFVPIVAMAGVTYIGATTGISGAVPERLALIPTFITQVASDFAERARARGARRDGAQHPLHPEVRRRSRGRGVERRAQRGLGGVRPPRAAGRVRGLGGARRVRRDPGLRRLGALEAAVIAGLVAAGVPNQVAVPAVFLYRLATFWVPLLPGWIAFHYLQRAEYV